MKRSYFKAVPLFAAAMMIAGQALGLELKSEAFTEGGTIPEKYTYAGGNVSPPLVWSDVPEGTKSFVLMMDDPDAPMGVWIHWVIYDIPAASPGLQEGIPPAPTLPDGTKQGMNSFRMLGYGGPAPPPGPSHRYIFTLYAVDITLEDVPPAAAEGDVLKAIQGHVLGWTAMVGMYGRER